MDEVRDWGITSSQMEARSSGVRSFALDISIMESNGLGSKGVNPEANLEVLKNPSEPHLRNWPGIAFSCGFWSADRVVKPRECFTREAEEDEAWARRRAADNARMLESLRIVISENGEVWKSKLVLVRASARDCWRVLSNRLSALCS